MIHTRASLLSRSFGQGIIITLIGVFALAFIPAFASAASLTIKDQVTTNIQYYFPIYAKSWNIPDGSMFTGFTGKYWTSTATNDFNIALMRIMQSPKGSTCPPTTSWWFNSTGDWNALFSAFPNIKNRLANGILKRPNAGSASLPMNYSLPAGYGVPIDGCVWAMLNGSALISGGNYTMGTDLQLQYETGTAASALTPLYTMEVGDEECYMLNGCGSFNTYDNSMQFINVQKFNAETALHAIHGNSGHSTFPNSPFLSHFSGTAAAGSWSVTDDFYIVPQCSTLPGGRQTADKWESKLPTNKQLIYTRTLGSTGMDVKQDPINKKFSPVVKIPAGGCLVHLVKRTGGSSLNTETQVVLFTQPKFASKNVSISIPTTMKAGQTYPVSVVMRNDGFETWTTATKDRLGLYTGGNNVWGWTRSNVPSSVSSHGTVTFTFNVKAPTTKGTYKFSARMLREGVQWFGPEKVVTITVTDSSTTAQPTLNFSISPTSVAVGGNVTATWSSSGATSCTASGSWSGSKALSGSQAIAVGTAAGTKTYTLACTGSGGTVTKSASVNVTSTTQTACGIGQTLSGGSCVTVPLTGTGDPVGYFDGLKSGTTEPTIHGWAYDPKASSASIGVHIYADGPASAANNYANFAASVVANTSRPDVNSARGITGNHGWEWVLPSNLRTGSHTYYIYAINLQAGGANTQVNGSPKTITVTAPSTTAQPTLNFSISPTSVAVGGNVTATWSSSGATSCTASGSWSGSKALSGSQAIAVGTAAGTKTYTLACTGSGGTVTKSASVNVTSSTASCWSLTDIYALLVCFGYM